MDLPVERRETLNDIVTTSELLDKVKVLLNAYLCEFGIRSAAIRARWTDRVIEELTTRAGLVANEDILEEAVENMRGLIEARVATIFNHDPARDHKEIAQILVVLLNEKYSDYLNRLFEHVEPNEDDETPQHLRDLITTSLPLAMPEEAPLAMPVQSIELHSFNPFRWLFGRST
jgi:hypothetical protein